MTGAAAARAGGRRIALLLEYDGTAYRGSQYQENAPSIQATLEAAINNLTGETRRCAFAGRTDAGVHALGQVAGFDTQSRLSIDELRRGMNHFLPLDIVVRQTRETALDFDPRRDATARLYRYRIENRRERPALERDRAWHVAKPLDTEAMRRATRRLEGEHDFAAFAGPYEGSTRRTLRRCELIGCGERLRLEMESPGFLPHQVRRTVGPLVEVGLGRMSEEDLGVLLDAARPASAAPTAPAHGLYLVSVTYDGFGFEPEDESGNGQSE